MKKQQRSFMAFGCAVRHGFTIVEILIVVTIIAILATVSIITFANMRWRSVDALVKNTASDAQKALQTYGVFNQKTYPSNIAGTEYAPPLDVALALYTNAAQIPVYTNLTPDQNAQLFLNSCNGFMPVTDGVSTYNESCSYAGQNLHVKGTVSTNIVMQGPTISQSDFQLSCGSACDTAVDSIVSTFIAEGGTFPIVVPSRGSTLPQPTMTTTGVATNYCLEARSPLFSDIVYHATQNAANPAEGPCDTTGLHYP